MHPEAVRPELWTLLNRLMAWPPLAPFALAGGTSLALRSGYRDSVDIDLFCHPGFEVESLRGELTGAFPGYALTSVNGAGLFGFLNQIKVDFLKHHQPWLEPFDAVEGIRLVSLADLAAMKINAVMGRGSKKDFSDLLFLHQQGLSLAHSVKLFTRKYSPDLLFAAIRSLNYFGDTEGEFDPLYRNGWTWDSVRAQMAALGAGLTRLTLADLEALP
jgi:Nucleotidyl transferase AbiEii toxin, Type IV TA system